MDRVHISGYGYRNFAPPMVVMTAMLGKRLLIGGVWAALALGTPFVAGAAGVAHRGIPCRPARAKLIAASGHVVVYLGRVLNPSNDTRYPTYLGCLRGGRSAYEVGAPAEGSSSGGSATRNLTLAGEFVAWEETETIGPQGPSQEQEWLVLVRNLRTGRVLHKLPTGVSTVKEWTGVGPTTQIVLTSAGAVAWIARVEDEQGEHGYEVHAADNSGTRVLATGSNIAAKSLALAGSTLYWTQGGAAMAAPVQ
jgi:hypothetical protein